MRIPIEGEPAEVVQIIEEYGAWLRQVPKLLITADPGAILRGPMLELCRTWPNQSRREGHPLHPEDQPHEIGEAVAAWLSKLA